MKKLKIVIVTDHPPNRNGFASPQTLYNLLRVMDQEYLIVADSNSIKWGGIDEQYKSVVLYKQTINLQLQNRLEKYLAPFRNFVNKKILRKNWQVVRKVEKFDTDAMLIVPNSIDCIRYGNWLAAKLGVKPLFYFMDDYGYYTDPWKKKVVTDAFRNAKGGLFVSEKLKTVFYNRYDIRRNLPDHLAHNPVNIANMQPLVRMPAEGDVWRLVYAGSIYNNHKDNLLLLCKALEQLNISGIKIILTIYTQQGFWDSFSTDLSDAQKEVVKFGGHIQYDHLHVELAKHHIGIITESHNPEFRSVAEASLQTKVNDYILGGLALWCIGPDYGACGDFLRTHKIGDSFVVNTITGLVSDITSVINKNETTIFQMKARNFLMTNNDSKSYKQRVLHFINEA